MTERYISIDIGGTYVRSIMAKKTEILSVNLSKVNKFLFVNDISVEKEIEKNISMAINCYLKECSNLELNGIGISLAASLDRNTGIIVSWPNHNSWVGFNFRKYLENKFQTKIIVEDDANCGALGEYYRISGFSKNMIYISFGTGIGSGIIINGRLFKGDSGFAGEIGHIDAGLSSMCVCGQKGCLQSIQGNYQSHIESIAKAIYNLVMVLDISLIIVGGGATIDSYFIGELNEKINDRLKIFKRKVEIRTAYYKEYSGIMGALQLFK